MATNGATSTTEESLTKSTRKQNRNHQQPQSINNIHLPDSSRQKVKEREQWLCQWSHNWTRRQSPEWKPRRASVASCQQQQHLHLHHHQQQQRMPSYDNNQFTLNYHHTLTDSSLRNYLIQRLQRPSPTSSTNQQQLQQNSRRRVSGDEQTIRISWANKKKNNNKAIKTIKVKSDQLPQCNLQSKPKLDACDGICEIEKHSRLGEAELLPCQASGNLTDFESGQKTDQLESRTLNLDSLCTSSKDCSEAAFTERKRRSTDGSIDTGGNPNRATVESNTNTNSNSNSNSNSESDSESYSYSLEQVTDTDTEVEQESEQEPAEETSSSNIRPVQPTGSLSQNVHCDGSSKKAFNRSPELLLDHQQHSYLAGELPKSSATTTTTTTTYCSFPTPPSQTSTSRSSNEPGNVTERPSLAGSNHGIIKELQLQEKQRKSLIFSMALKKLISDSNSNSNSNRNSNRNSKLQSECCNCRSDGLSNTDSTSSSPRFRRTGNNKVNLSQTRNTDQLFQEKEQRSVSVALLGDSLLVSGADRVQVVDTDACNKPEEAPYETERSLEEELEKGKLSICARCYHRQKSSDNLGLKKVLLKGSERFEEQHLMPMSSKMTRNLQQQQQTLNQQTNNQVQESSLAMQQEQSEMLMQANRDRDRERDREREKERDKSIERAPYFVNPRKSTTSIELFEDNDCDLESLIVESWLDDHPNFAHDYFMRKANHQLIDDWLISHAKVSNTNLKSSQLDLVVNFRSSESRLSQHSLSSHLQNFSSGLRSGSESPSSGGAGNQQMGAKSGAFLSARPESQQSGAATPVRKISATDFESRTGSNFLRPMVSTTPDGKPTFLSQLTVNDEESSKVVEELQQQQQQQQQSSKLSCSKLNMTKGEMRIDEFVPGILNNNSSDDLNDEDELTCNDEVKLIFELVKNICNDLDIKTLLHKILKNIAVLINADKSSLFLVCGEIGDPNRHLVSQLFNVDQDDSELVQCELKENECIRIPWGTGLVGYVAESGESLNIENCYDDPRFTNTIDQRTGYVTKHMLCAPIFDKRNEIVGVAQVINKRDGRPFSKSDELKFKRYLQFCGIGLRNAQSYEHCQLENKRNQVLLDLARMVFEEQSTIEQVVYRIMLHTQSLLECQRCQVLLIDDGSDDLDQLLQLPNTLGEPSRSSTSTCWLGGQARHQQHQFGSTSSIARTSQLHQQSQSQTSSHETPEWRPHCSAGQPESAPANRAASNNQQSASAIDCASNTSTFTSNQTTFDGKHQDEPSSVSMSQQQQQQSVNVGISRQKEAPKQASPTKLFSLVFDLECDGNDLVMHSNKSEKSTSTSASATTTTTTSSSSSNTANKKTRQFPINFGITGYVAMTGETLNIENAHEHERFDPSVDEGSNFKHKSILCMPIRNGQRKIIGVSQLINKKNGRAFNKNDEDLFEAFAIFCGLGIHNTLMYEKVLKIMAKQRVTFEVLSYHATAPLEEAKKLHLEQIPSCFALNLTSLKFNDFSLDEQYMLKSCLRFFLDLDLMRRFHIDQLVFCNWILSVQKNYRKVTYHPIVGGSGLKAAPVRYHNWRHAFNVSQMMFAILINTQICQALGELETLALLIACLCHDLDHRGTNNSFQIKSASPLAELYSTSTMEHHHFDQCVMILNSQGNQILANLSPEEYSRVIVLLEEAILATDLANYFQKREIFFQLVNSDTFDWHNNPEHRSLLRCMLMTACDVAAITKPWSVQKVVAGLVMSEFYQQGDIERQELNIEPIDMMNRDKMSKLPEMQIGFIDSICAPIYAAFAKLFPHELGPLLEGCLTNRDLWAEVAKNNNNNNNNKSNYYNNTVDSSPTSNTNNDAHIINNQTARQLTTTKSNIGKHFQSLCNIASSYLSAGEQDDPLLELDSSNSLYHHQSANVDCQRKSV